MAGGYSKLFAAHARQVQRYLRLEVYQVPLLPTDPTRH